MSLNHYAELFCQTNFSFLQGASHPEELVSQADFLGYRAIAITDECSMAGVARAYSGIKDNQLGIKLIVGSVLHLGQTLSLLLLCPEHQAYAELCRIITNARRRSEKGQYQLESWDLRSSQHCLAIWLPKGDEQQDQQWGKWLTRQFSGRLWLGCQRHLVANEGRYIEHCKALAQQFGLLITACGGVLMHQPQRLALQHTLSAIKQGKSVAEMGRELLPNSERSLRSLQKLNSLYPSDWLMEAVRIAELCHFDMQEIKQHYQYPAEIIPAGKGADQYLRELVEQGIKRRFPEGLQQYPKIALTIQTELELIAEKNYQHYFLTIYDIVQFAKRQRILYQGRGSAANSIVCYCLEITSVDPRQIDVLFARFISKERDQEPDIDVDFEHQRREEVIQYIYTKYGRERTALAATVSTYRTKSALREVGKALGINPTRLDYFVKNINHRDRDLGWEVQISKLGFDHQSHQGQMFRQLVNQIKGFPRHLSQHVGGFVIASQPMYQLVPIENAAMPDRSVIQWDKDDLESLGLIKVDVLALGMLTAIRKSFALIWQHYGRELSIADITRMGDDPKVYTMIQQADTVGVFQIESRAQMSMLPRLKPANYYDLVIQIAIVRPGPIQGGMVHPFLKRRDGIERAESPSEALKPVLERTNGVPIFQEQVIRIAMVAAGFSGGEADQLRRAMGTWKKSGELAEHGEKLIKGMLANGYTEAYAKQIFEQIKGFGEYGFPESHSASFAVLAYVSSWLKHYYPAAFYVGLLNSWPMGFYPPAQLIADAKRHHIQVLPVCVNHSGWDHVLEPYQDSLAIRLGLRQVKGLSAQAGELLIKQRPENGYQHPAELKSVAIKQGECEALASANALRMLGAQRYQARWQLMDSEPDLALFKAQVSLSGYEPRPANALQNLLEDYATTSLSLEQHPISLLRQAGLLPKHTRARDLIKVAHKQVVTVIGVVIGRQRPGTSKGVTFMTLEDDSGNINVIVWLATARQQKKHFLKSTIVQVRGILERGDGGVTHVIAGKIEDKSALLAELNSKSRDFH